MVCAWKTIHAAVTKGSEELDVINQVSYRLSGSLVTITQKLIEGCNYKFKNNNT